MAKQESGSLMRVRRTKHKRKQGIPKPPPTGKQYKAAEHRAHYVLSVIDDQPWLDGKFRKLSGAVQERYKVGRRAADESVTRAYELLRREHERQLPMITNYLIRIHQKTIELGMRRDLKVITGAATELRKLVGVGEPDRIQLSGTTTTISQYDHSLLAALKLTNAQRLAEIDRMQAEKDAEDAEPASESSPVVEPVPEEPGDDLEQDESYEPEDEDEN